MELKEENILEQLLLNTWRERVRLEKNYFREARKYIYWWLTVMRVEHREIDKLYVVVLNKSVRHINN